MSRSCGNPEAEKDAVLLRESHYCIQMFHNEQSGRSPEVRQGEGVYKMQNEDRKYRYPLRSILQVCELTYPRNALTRFSGSVFF